jgi:O-antigen/teichoic acid export membrane protein
VLDQVKQTVKHALIYSVGNAANKLVGFILLPLYTSSFAVAEYGLIALFDTIFDLITAVSSLGIMQGLKRWYWDNAAKGKQKTLFFTVLVFTLVLTLLFLLICFYVASNFDTQIFGVAISTRTLLLFLGSVLSNVLLQQILVLLRIQQKVIENTIFNIVKMFLVLGSTVYFIVGLNWGIDSVFISRLIGQTLTLLILLPQIIKNCEIKFNRSVWGIFKEMFSYSWPLALSASLGLVLTFSDRWLLRGLVSLDAVGNYSLAYRIANIIKLIIVQSFSQAFIYIYFRKMNSKKDYRFFSKTATYFSFLMVSMGLAIVVFSKEIIVLFARSTDYYGSYFILPILILSVSFSGLRQMLSLPLSKHKKTKIISLVSISAGLLNIGLNFIFIPIWQGVGAALATAFSHLIVVVIYLVLNRRIADFDYEVKKILLLFILGSMLAYGGMQMGDMQLWIRISAKLILLVIFPIILKAFNFFEDIELLRIRQTIRKWWNPLNWKENFKDINLRDKK